MADDTRALFELSRIEPTAISFASSWLCSPTVAWKSRFRAFTGAVHGQHWPDRNNLGLIVASDDNWKQRSP
jgi:hypothetical protein